MGRKIYLEIAEDIKKNINNGTYPEGTKLLGEKKLTSLYGVSRTTIRNSLHLLLEEGYILRVKGSGTYIKKRKIIQDRSSFSHLYTDLNNMGVKLSSSVVSKGVLKASKEVAAAMNIKPEEKVYQIVWIRLADGEPVIYETVHLLYSLVKGIDRINLDNVNLYSLLLEKYSLKISHGEEAFYPCFLSDTEGRFLKKDTGSLGMNVKKVAYCSQKTVEYTSSVVRGDRFIYKTIFKGRD